jgi:hypothetical protein
MVRKDVRVVGHTFPRKHNSVTPCAGQRFKFHANGVAVARAIGGVKEISQIFGSFYKSYFEVRYARRLLSSG